MRPRAANKSSANEDLHVKGAARKAFSKTLPRGYSIHGGCHLQITTGCFMVGRLQNLFGHRFKFPRQSIIRMESMHYQNIITKLSGNFDPTLE
ncbi:hypothetical protein CDAR_119081 [Caerostris darwini]|uniref:Uncharacterized protein n=1 Tax=Caerostris darwini TaxID=1538125 RepID=A0AAV4VAU4_9ARAC|nr:hypothetical protein CDAR_119081 [Caerostris darwini]